MNEKTKGEERCGVLTRVRDVFQRMVRFVFKR